MAEEKGTGYPSLDSLTVVIASYERPSNLAQTFSFLESVGLKAIVMDGSDSINVDLARSTSPLLKYVHAPFTRYEERMAAAAEFVETRYTLSMSDDEYFVPSALQSAIQFLDLNSGYVACLGQVIGFSVEKGEVCWEIQSPELGGFSLDNEKPIARLASHISRYRVCAYYSIVKSEIWARAWKEISKHDFRVFAISELQFEAAVSYSGKIRVLPCLFWIRNLVNPPVWISNVSITGKRLEFREWWGRRDFNDEKQKFIDVMVKMLGSNAPIDELATQPALRSTLELSFTNYARYHSPLNQARRNINSNLRHRIENLRNYITKKIPKPIPYSILSPGTYVDENWLERIKGRIRLTFRSECKPHTPIM